ncbi:acyltransferase [Sphingomonas sp. LB-2]|nr:acyltransferase [Sphingomonas caeni]
MADLFASPAAPRDPLADSGRTLEYRPDLDGLRGVMALVVLAAHLGWLDIFPGAAAALDLFFVVSGYLITHVILSDRAAGKFSYARYYERRIRRLFPALFALLAVSAVLGFWVIPESARHASAASLAATALYANNLLIGLHPIGEFAQTPLPHTWSLGVEEQYYLLYPPLLVALLARGRGPSFWGMLGFTALLLAVSMLTSTRSVSAYFLTTSRVWEIFLGCALALHGGRLSFTRPVRELLGAIGCAAIVLTSLRLPIITSFHAVNVIPICLGTALLLLANEGSQTWSGRLLSRQPWRFAGIASYSVYLWHWPIIIVAQRLWGQDFPIWLRVILFAVAVAAGILSWRYIEMPFRRPDAILTRRGTFVFAIAGMAIFALIGAIGFVMTGR